MNRMVHKDGRKTRHENRRPEVLASTADYVLANGLRGLSVRPMAEAVGISHRTLLYHFGTKDQLVIEVLDHLRERDKGHIRAHLAKANVEAPADLFRAAWRQFSAPERMHYIRLFHEVFVLGLSGAPYDAWAAKVSGARTAMIGAALRGIGCPDDRADAAATLVVASIRGLLLHLAATGDRAGADAAFEELLSGLVAQLPAIAGSSSEGQQ